MRIAADQQKPFRRLRVSGPNGALPYGFSLNASGYAVLAQVHRRQFFNCFTIVVYICQGMCRHV
jgi:hypothetical protein